MSTILPAGMRDPAAYPPELRHPVDGADRACRICGERRGRSDPDDRWVEDAPLDWNGPTRAVRDEYGVLVDQLRPQAWRWRHVACTPTYTAVVAALLSVEVAEDVARAAIDAAEVDIARSVNHVSRKPWGHVTAEQRSALRVELGKAVAGTLPQRHVSGRCAWCGRSRSMRWWKSAQTWADGSGVVCDSCNEADRTVQSWDEVARRRAGVRLFAGLVDAIGHGDVHWGFRFASEVVPEGERHADGRAAWTYSQALADVRMRAYRGEPGSIADPVDGERWRRLAAAHRAKERRDQEAAQAEEAAEPPIAW